MIWLALFLVAPPPTPAIDELAMGGVRLEGYYVHQLCSPTRTALLSSRFAYSIGMDDGVIVDGTDSDLELNLLTMADHLQKYVSPAVKPPPHTLRISP